MGNIAREVLAGAVFRTTAGQAERYEPVNRGRTVR